MSLPFSHDIRVSDKARRIAVRVLRDGTVELVIPRRASRRAAEAFLRSREAWILRTVEHQKRLRKNPPLCFEEGMTVIMLGEPLTIAVAPTHRRSHAERKGKILHVALRDTDLLHDVVVQWCKKEAAVFFAETTSFYCDQLGATHGRITVKDQKTLWGSCSRKGNLNFSWRLILAPLAVAQYVVAHECAHLIHLNHSVKFWKTVEKICPDYTTHVTWLKKHGCTLR